MKIIQRYVSANGLSDKVYFKGDHCFDKCSEGPNIMIGGRIFSNVSEDNIQQILKESLQDLIKSGG